MIIKDVHLSPLRNRFLCLDSTAGYSAQTSAVGSTRYSQAEKRNNSWLSTIREERVQIKLLLQDRPSLKPYLDEVFLAAYELGLALAIRETQLGEQLFPEICPYTPEQTMNPEFMPES